MVFSLRELIKSRNRRIYVFLVAELEIETFGDFLFPKFLLGARSIDSPRVVGPHIRDTYA